MKKKRILFQSDSALAKTGFGRNSKEILSYLYKTGKYEIFHYCCGTNKNEGSLKRLPWKCIGTMPSDKNLLVKLNEDPNQGRDVNYGGYFANEAVKECKPDVFIGVQDIWGVETMVKKPWFNKITSALWTTLDSLPILPTAINAAKKVENFWVWSNFAEKDMKKQGINNVKTLHGALDERFFYKVDHNERMLLRSKAGLSPNDFVVGFVFRNQLRKSVPNLLEGFSLLKKQNLNKNRLK